MTASTGPARTVPAGVSSASRVLGTLLRWGVPLGPLYLLETRGRRSGRQISTPVALVSYEHQQWLVSPFGRVGWVLNYQANAVASLMRGRIRRPIELVEVHDARRAAVQRQFRSSFRFVPFVRRAFSAHPADGLEAFEAEADQHPVYLTRLHDTGATS